MLHVSGQLSRRCFAYQLVGSGPSSSTICGMFTRNHQSRGAQAHGVVGRCSVLGCVFCLMLALTLLSTCAGVGLSLRANATAHASKGTTFMIISGITSGSEMCLTAAGSERVGAANAQSICQHLKCFKSELVVWQSVEEVSRLSFCRASSRSELAREASFGLSRRRAL